MGAVSFSLVMILVVNGASVLLSLAAAVISGIVALAATEVAVQGTSYSVVGAKLSVKGVIRSRSIEVSNIRLLIDADRPSSGNHPGLGDDGIMIHYGAGGMLYVSPVEKEAFVSELQSINSKIVYKSKLDN